MAMTYTTLVAPKGTAGSIANWVNYTRLDLETILDEAQSLLMTMMRVREMRTTWLFGLAAGACWCDLPTGFLDPIGRMRSQSHSIRMRQTTQSEIEAYRVFETLASTLLANPMLVTSGSRFVSVTKASHGLTQGSDITFANASTSFGGVNFNNMFPIVAVTDADTFVIDAGQALTISGNGGGTAATYVANRMMDGTPACWSVWDDRAQFDMALIEAMQFRLAYYRRPDLLSSSSPTNFLTARYPHLLRKACVASAADFMKDDTEYQKGVAALSAMIQTVNAENDMIHMGAELDTETP